MEVIWLVITLDEGEEEEEEAETGDEDDLLPRGEVLAFEVEAEQVKEVAGVIVVFDPPMASLRI